MDEIIKEHIKKFGIEPVMIGKFWDDNVRLFNNIADAIDNNIPYNEYNLLTKEQQKAFDAGELLF